MEFILSNLEHFSVYVLGTGAVLFLLAFLWLVVAAFRGAQARGSLVFFFLAAALALSPALISFAHGRWVDLGRPVRLLNNDLQIGLRQGASPYEEIAHLKVRAAVQLAGFALGVIGFLWLVASACRNWSRVKWPVYLFLLAAILLATPFGVNRLLQRYIDFGPRERLVNGEPTLTLTGWDRDDYSILRFRPETVVLQMANPDVTDETLRYVAEMSSLRELDLGNTKVSDAGLVNLAGLPLETLRLTRTGISDAGFREYIVPIETLMKLDLSGTAVSPEAVQEWRKAKPGRKALR